MIFLAFFSQAFFRVEERIELIWHLYKNIGVNESFNLRYQACTNTGSVREIRRFPYGMFSFYTGNSMASSAEKYILRNILFEQSIKTQQKKCPAGLLKHLTMADTHRLDNSAFGKRSPACSVSISHISNLAK